MTSGEGGFGLKGEGGENGKLETKRQKLERRALRRHWKEWRHEVGATRKRTGLKTRHYSYLWRCYLPPRLDLERISGQRAKMEVVKPPRGVNSPRTTHHSGCTAATMSRRILFTAFS
jgi:hypothetical protein